MTNDGAGSRILGPRLRSLLVLCGIFAFSRDAYANAGTPLMWAGMLHLVFGNALIGVGEGLVLSFLFSVRPAKSIVVMIIANYASAWLGGLYISGAIVRTLPLDLNNGWKWFWAMVAITYCITLVLEWPFISFCLRGKTAWFRKSVQATLVVQTVSYLLLFGWYWSASRTSLYTRMTIASPADLSLPESVFVYYINPKDGSVYKRPLAGGVDEKIFDLHSTNANDRLFVRPSPINGTKWDLIARLESKDYKNPIFKNVLTNLNIQAAQDSRAPDNEPAHGTAFNFGNVPRLGATGERWVFWSGFWSAEGLKTSNTVTSNQFRFAYETPFGAWEVRNAVHLPTDKVLFQLGENQICAFDPETRRVALLWHGRSPVPVIPTASAP